MEEIFRPDQLSKFWPTEKQSARERVHATTRFIVYLSVILYLIRRDIRVVIMGVAALGVLYYMYQNGMIREPMVVYKQPVNPDNVMNNGNNSTGPPDGTSLKEAWDTIHPFSEGRWFAEHNFYTAPGVDNKQFVTNAYSSMILPNCREDPRYCDPDSMTMGRGMEWVHRKTFQRV